MNAEGPKRRGRPRLNRVEPRPNITFQCPAALKARLQSRADAEGCSLSRVVEDMLRERFEMADISVIIRDELRSDRSLARSEADWPCKLERGFDKHLCDRCGLGPCRSRTIGLDYDVRNQHGARR